MASQPRFASECTEAFNSMNTQESPNDYFVCGFEEGGSNTMTLVEAGKGGMARVKEVLREQFSDKTAVALFRVTAVDDRENTVSYRTKIIHVIYTGPQTPVMKRAKIASFNAAFKQPFSFNLAIQTDDEEGDLSEASIEKSLRASGGAHQPTRFDFTNCSAPGEGESKVIRMASSRSPSHAAPSPKASPAAASPAPEEDSGVSAEDVFKHHGEAIDAKDADQVALDYADDAMLFHTDATNKRTSVYTGREEIAGYYKLFIDQHADSLQVSNSSIIGNVITVEFSTGAGIEYGYDVFHVLNGKVKVQTVVTVTGSTPTAEEPAAEEPEAVDEVYERTEQEADQAAGEAVEQATEAVDEAVAEAPQEEEAVEEAPAEEAPTEEAVEEAPAEDAPAEEAAEEAADEAVAEEQ